MTKMTIASKLGHCSVIRTMERTNLLLYKMSQLLSDRRKILPLTALLFRHRPLVGLKCHQVSRGPLALFTFRTKHTVPSVSR